MVRSVLDNCPLRRRPPQEQANGAYNARHLTRSFELGADAFRSNFPRIRCSRVEFDGHNGVPISRRGACRAGRRGRRRRLLRSDPIVWERSDHSELPHISWLQTHDRAFNVRHDTDKLDMELHASE